MSLKHLKINGNNSDILPKSVSTGSLTMTTGATAGYLLSSDATGISSWTNPTALAVTAITGTANQIIASAAIGAVTLSLPQNLSTTSAMQFGSIQLGANSVFSQLDSGTFSVTIGAGATGGPFNVMYIRLGQLVLLTFPTMSVTLINPAADFLISGVPVAIQSTNAGTVLTAASSGGNYVDLLRYVPNTGTVLAFVNWPTLAPLGGVAHIVSECTLTYRI